MFNELKEKKIHLIGVLGAEGSSLALFLINKGFKNLIGHDFSDPHNSFSQYSKFHPGLSQKVCREQLKKIKSGLISLHYKKTYLNDIFNADVVLVPYSWYRYPVNKPLVKIEKAGKLRHWYNLLLEYYPGKLIGVTGTAGKGTTVNLIKLILQSSNKHVENVGDSWQYADWNKIFTAKKADYLVAEISNRALKFAKYTKKSPFIAVITNITKNHLDDHDGSFKKYIETKKELARYQKKNDILIINGDNPTTKKLSMLGAAKKIFFRLKSPEINLIKNKTIQGNHLISDALAAIKVAKILKISNKHIIKGINRYQPREGRMQLIKIHNDIMYINDAASTRPEAAMAAVESFPKAKVNLILEGSRHKPDKKQYANLIKIINKCRVKNLAVSGQISNFLSPMLKKTDVNVIYAKNLTESCKKIFFKARSGEVVLLSPSCESFGEFKDYRERIKLFNNLITKFVNGQKF